MVDAAAQGHSGRRQPLSPEVQLAPGRFLTADLWTATLVMAAVSAYSLAALALGR